MHKGTTAPNRAGSHLPTSQHIGALRARLYPKAQSVSVYLYASMYLYNGGLGALECLETLLFFLLLKKTFLSYTAVQKIDRVMRVSSEQQRGETVTFITHV